MEFTKDKRRPDGLGSRCLSCDRLKSHNRYFQNPELEKEKDKKYRTEHPEKVTQKNKKWYEANKEKVYSANSQWRVNNLEKERERTRNYRSRRYGNGDVITSQEWIDLKDYYQFTCLCCKRTEPHIKLELDHVVPLSKGGRNLIENAQPLCRSCNSSKNDKTIDYR